MSVADSIRKSVFSLMKFKAFRSFSSLPIALGNLFRKEKLAYERQHREQLEDHIWQKYLNNDLEVIDGPFKGLRYPRFVSFTSARLPKLLGTYESEIYEDLERLMSRKFDLIIDIGAAEGYYAVGMALRKADTPVRCFDLNPEAIFFCREMAELNVASNLSVEALFEQDEFADMQDKAVLIFCDVDGYEKYLFKQDIVGHLKNSFLVIETHDYLDPAITVDLVKLFEPTHSVKVIPWVADKSAEVPELMKNATAEEKRLALKERIVDNKWLIIEPK